MEAIDKFAVAFVEAALFADTPEGYEGNGERIGLASGEGERMREFARGFYAKHSADIAAYPEGVTQAGHDLWFTMNGHGVGYWENKGEAAERLNEAAKALRMSDGLYEGDDGLLYWAN